MSNHRRARRFRVALLSLLLLLGFTAVPLTAHADAPDPMDSVIFIFFTGGDHAGQTATVHADVRPADEGPAYPSGSVQFSVGDPAPVPLDPQYLNAQSDFTIASNSPITVTATFTGTNGWHNSTRTVTFQPLTQTFLYPLPTIAKITPGVPTLTLKFAVYLRNSIGGGVPGHRIAFTLFGPVPNVIFPHAFSVPVCTAVTDATGLAKCTGVAQLSVIVSLLTNGAYATEMSGPAPGLYSIKLPSFGFGTPTPVRAG